MTPVVMKTTLKEILYLRNLFLQENNFQIRYNACHERGWTDSYLVCYKDNHIGYGSIKGNEKTTDRDTIFEFYLIPPYRTFSNDAFLELLKLSKAKLIVCQSNDPILSAMQFFYGKNINSDTVLLQEHTTTDLKMDNVIFRKRSDSDIIFDHKVEPIGAYVLELNKEIVGTGGFLTHYNFPFADLYMEVKESHRRMGLGSFLIQEIKKQCYLAGRVPAARTGTHNTASKATLLKAGLSIAGFMLLGEVNSLH